MHNLYNPTNILLFTDQYRISHVSFASHNSHNKTTCLTCLFVCLSPSQVNYYADPYSGFQAHVSYSPQHPHHPQPHPHKGGHYWVSSVNPPLRYGVWSMEQSTSYAYWTNTNDLDERLWRFRENQRTPIWCSISDVLTVLSKLLHTANQLHVKFLEDYDFFRSLLCHPLYMNLLLQFAFY